MQPTLEYLPDPARRRRLAAAQVLCAVRAGARGADTLLIAAAAVLVGALVTWLLNPGADVAQGLVAAGTTSALLSAGAIRRAASDDAALSATYGHLLHGRQALAWEGPDDPLTPWMPLTALLRVGPLSTELQNAAITALLLDPRARAADLPDILARTRDVLAAPSVVARIWFSLDYPLPGHDGWARFRSLAMALPASPALDDALPGLWKAAVGTSIHGTYPVDQDDLDRFLALTRTVLGKPSAGAVA